MTIPNIATFDRGTFGEILNLVNFLFVKPKELGHSPDLGETSWKLFGGRFGSKKLEAFIFQNIYWDVQK